MVKARVHVIISGKVQGVFFRQKTKQIAQSLDVKGWIQNLPNGKVEAVFEGDEPSVKALIDYCYHGPSSARVDNVEANHENYVGEFSDFATL